MSVAIGELAEGLEIDLDKIPKKYEGLDGTELAISESQERMAIVVAKENVKKFQMLTAIENIESTVVAKVSKEPRMKMYWRGKKIVDISREFLNTNGVVKKSNIEINKPKNLKEFFENKVENNIKKWKETVSDLNCCSQKGLVERFDSTIGAATILMPFGGKYQLTPIEAMCARIPTYEGYTNSGTIMSFGYDPYLFTLSPFHGAIYAIVESVSKYVAVGGNYKKAWLTLQEYFEKLQNDPQKWGKPFSALLGSYYVQKKLNIAAIGGKDSMSGSYNNLNVPPTLVSFCIGVANTKKIVSNEFKSLNSKVVILKTKMTQEYLPDFESLKENYEIIFKLIQEEKIKAVSTIKRQGIAEQITKMCIGNKLGFEFVNKIDLFKPMYGSFILELEPGVSADKFEELGKTKLEEKIIISKNEKLDLNEIIELWLKPLEKVFETKVKSKFDKIENILSDKKVTIISKEKFAHPRIFIPVFPGTNCEYDSEKAFTDAGGITKTVVFKNLKSRDIEESILEMEKAIKEAQIIMIPGGFSAGDEPEGSGKFINAVFRNPKLKDVIHNHLNNKDGLMIGICNGFQALIKLGLVPYGKIVNMTENSPTLTFNTIARHQSKLVTTKVVSKLSPWFNKIELGQEFVLPISHGEGRFIATEQELEKLIKNGQIATQYVDDKGDATYDIRYNPNNSLYAIEGITSIDRKSFR